MGQHTCRWASTSVRLPEAHAGLAWGPAGIVEAWAAGSTWAQVMADCNLDDGDVARLLSRTVDLLRQAAHCPALLAPLRATARRAAQTMCRAPISELVS